MPYTEKEKKKVLERERQERQERPLRVLFTTPEEKKELGQKLTSCLTTSVPHLRMTGGGLAKIIVSKNVSKNIVFFLGSNDPSKRRTGKLPRTDSECQLKAPGIKFLSGKYPKVTTHEVTIPPSITSTNKLREKCDFFPKFEDKNPLRNQITQTLYR